MSPAREKEKTTNTKDIVDDVKNSSESNEVKIVPKPSRPDPPECVVELTKRIKTPYPIILVVTFEESRLIESIMEYVVGRNDSSYSDDQDVWVWSFAQGLGKLPNDTDPVQALADFNISEDTTDPNVALNYIHREHNVGNDKIRSIFVMRDLHKFWDRPDVGRRLRDMAEGMSMSDKVIVVTSPEMSLPSELDKTVSVIDFDLPSKSEIDYEVRMSLHSLGNNTIDNSLEDIIGETTDVESIKLDYSDQEIEHIVDACAGLTRFEIWCAMGKCIEPGNGIVEVPVILAEKEQIVAKSGIVEFWSSNETLEDIGGLDTVKEYIDHTKHAFTDAAHAFGVEYPRGLLLLGKPGSAKSLLVKATANYYQIPCLRLDIGKVMAGVVGGSEGNTRRALKTAEAVAPCILWIDEIEKGLSGTGSSNFSDAGTMSRVFGTIMQWMQDRTKPVYVMATANNIDQLPPELLRKGRVDEIFFIDVPTKIEKEEIFSIHLRKRNRDASRFNLDRLSDLVYSRKGKEYPYSGAEIEAAIQESIRRAYANSIKSGIKPEINGEGDITTDLLEETLLGIVPLSCTYHEQMDKMRRWAMDRARFGSRSSEEEVRSSTARTASTENDDGDTLTADLNVSSSNKKKEARSKGAMSKMRKARNQ